ncbi:putative vacuolar protein sorting-associated protein [Helianthus anomalus]
MFQASFLKSYKFFVCREKEKGKGMAMCGCLSWNRVTDVVNPDFEYFSLPSPIPQWPPGHGFATGTINLGEIEVCEITKFEFIWGSDIKNRRKGVNFFKPVGIPDGYFCLGHYCQSDRNPLRGFVLVAREVSRSESPALLKPVDYTLVWCPDDWTQESVQGHGYFWFPMAPEGYKPLGFIVTNKPAKPSLDEIRCVRDDLTDVCEPHGIILSIQSKISESLFSVWKTRPCNRGVNEKGVSVGTFFCSCLWSPGEDLNISCLKNINPGLHSMPNLDQVHALIEHYGPTFYFHPDEIYLPSSVPWFFENGALLYKRGEPEGQRVDPSGSNLPQGGRNDGEYWMDLPKDSMKKKIKKGNLESAKVYVHVKPALGGTFTDIQMWVFCPFNGPGCLKIGLMNYQLSTVGQHVGDWEHIALRISNFTGDLWSVYLSQHSAGVWVDPSDLEFIEGNKPIVYASRNGHANYPHAGDLLQGSANLRIGIRNTAAFSKYSLDSSKNYEIIAAEYLGDGVINEPCWLQYMRKWGPTTVHDSRAEMNRTLNRLPETLRYTAQIVFNKLPNELYGEDGPTGPKEKSSWFGDEKC